jgi:hypothetical protein
MRLRFSIPVLAIALAAGSALAFAAAGGRGAAGQSAPAAQARPAAHGGAAPSLDEHWGFLDEYCNSCHNVTDWAGGVAFDALERSEVGSDAKVWEEVVRRLRGSLMPPPGEKQPDAASRHAFIKAMEGELDAVAGKQVEPGSVPLHRLNRPEYANAIRDLLDLEVNATALLPRDDQSAGFDNIAEVLKISPSFLEQYLTAARQVSIEALGNPKARMTSTVYRGAPNANQYMHIEGLPLGTRGGMLIEHNFPADGEYEVTINGLVGGGYVWGVMDPNQLIVTVDDERVFQAQVGGEEDLEAVDVEQAVGVGAIDDRFRNIRIKVPAGRHRVGVTFLQKTAAEHDEILHAFNPVAGMAQHVNGNSDGPRIASVEIKGPLSAAGVSDTPSRRRLLVCRPATEAEEVPCAKRIFLTLAKRAFRQPVGEADIAGAMQLFEEGRRQGGFETGIQKGVMVILASPRFLYRAHTPPEGTKPGEIFRISDLDLATRLSFFLWSSIPDEELIDVAAAGRLRDPRVLDAQLRRMLKDPRARSLATNFANQWLNVRGLELVNPDPNLFPDYTEDLIPAFTEELHRFVWSIFEEDRNVIDLLTADHTFLNERLAIHYGIPGVRGGEFRRVKLEQPWRRGLLGKGAILMVTSYANRTTPVLRGSYILEHLMGTPPAAPPPDVEAFPESQEGGEQLTVRARLEAHRAVKSCHSCHGVIDPLGIALENFNAIGQWREKDIDAGTPIDAAGQLADGTPLSGPDDLREALASRPDLFVHTFVENLLTYALGRKLEYYDMPMVRRIVRDAADEQYRFSTLVRAVVESPAFQTARAPAPEQQPGLTASVHGTP